MCRIKLIILISFLMIGKSESQIYYNLESEIFYTNSAEEFVISPLNQIYLTDINNNKIIKFNLNDKTEKSIGGFGWDEYSFSKISDINSYSLNIIISDKDNNRILVFDKDLNFLWEFNSETVNDKFQYPVSAAIDELGNIYILDEENSTVFKFNSKGEFLLDFGGYDHKDFILSEPIKIRIHNQNIFVLDSKLIYIFDEFGNGISKIQLENSYNNISLLDNKITLTNNKKVSFIDLKNSLKENIVNFAGLEDNITFKKAVIKGNKIYLLTDDGFFKLAEKKAD